MAIDFPNSPTNGQEFTSGGTSWVYDGTKWSIKQATSYSNDSAPVGTVLNFAGPAGSIPAGWIACDGSAVSRSTYATLFSVIGTTYGSGNGSTTFNLPDIDGTFGVFIIRWTTTLGVTATDSLYTAPVGAMLNWPTTSSYPTGWLRADGSAVSRTSYADLFILIGTAYGSGDGSTTFNLPNLVETGGPVTIIKATMSGGQPPSTVAHAASHIRGGTDIIDGDRVQVDYVPSNYTRNSAATGAGATTDLTAHLGGIDSQLPLAWATFTPALTGSWAVGNGTITGKYTTSGKICHFWMSFTLGSTSTKGTDFYINLPVAAASNKNSFNINAEAVDFGTQTYPLYVGMEDSTANILRVMVIDASTAFAKGGLLNSTQPFTWGTGDIIRIAGTYEAA